MAESSSAAAESSSAAMSLEEKKKKFNDKFRALHQKRQEARKQNHEQVVEEDRKSKLPVNYEAKKARQEWELEEIEAKKKAEEEGQDYTRLKSLNTQADIADKIEAARKRKKNPDQGFADYEQMSLRQHQRLTNAMKPDMSGYKKMREFVGEEQFYPSADTLIQGSHYPTSSALDRMSEAANGMAKSREQYHRRRMFDPDAPIDYINEKNRKFNQKLDKYYGKYTEDLRDDIERGTAI
ncbi:hypothetical protein PMAYCL1PPCAC_02549 [Pristionchus mayeri]|uniref:Pre-mRNA-splicing factor SYF2 n=1 Tax=Pristionchus mayeri TaxID=1317129 RepID=A0AAN4Z353_9BILA|nr:hypothetical protein PMAYCL1PPCAC_02549 [Pristionchus mayeri]